MTFLRNISNHHKILVPIKCEIIANNRTFCCFFHAQEKIYICREIAYHLILSMNNCSRQRFNFQTKLKENLPNSKSEADTIQQMKYFSLFRFYLKGHNWFGSIFIF